MKKVILIPDSFKGTMSSSEICDIMEETILSHYPECNVKKIPVADGGEGTVDAFLSSVGGRKIYTQVTGPLGERVESFYGLIDSTAIIEMAAAAGLPLVGENKDVLHATTYGVGELIMAAVGSGAKKIVVGLGGSATNDGGCGAAAACGVKFYDSHRKEFVPVGATLCNIEKIDASGLHDSFKDVEIVTMCDIDNPLCGESGAAFVFGPQKGAGPDDVRVLDDGLRKLASIVRRDVSKDILNIPGAGAAGGMGGGMVAFFGSELQMGIETVLDVAGFDSMLPGTDAVFTGEGRIDTQSLRGKVVIGVARRAKEADVPVIAVVGDIGDDISGAYDEGVSVIFSINRVAIPFSEAKKRARSDLALTLDTIMRFMKICRTRKGKYR